MSGVVQIPLLTGRGGFPHCRRHDDPQRNFRHLPGDYSLALNAGCGRLFSHEIEERPGQQAPGEFSACSVRKFAGLKDLGRRFLMELKLYDTLTKEKRVFTPLDPKRVRMYVCGPTVYDFAHIGNARPVIVFDVLYRLLRHLYGASHVKYVRNITDVDDKINARAAERGIAIRQLTEETYKNFKDDVAALGCLPPDVEPRATEHIEEMKVLIEKLVASKHAYVAEEHVLFSVPSMSDYGQLSRRSLDEMIAGARVDVAPYKRDAMDFVLWKPSKEGDPAWPSPSGIKTPGRPGWHIECSAMSWKHLGETFDIHGGGIDLVFPHHENEIAQTRCAFHSGVMANYWMHNGFLQVEGEKMAKSAGNFVTIRELLTNWEGVAWPGEALRFNMLRTHYRQPIDWTYEGLDESHKVLWDWYKFLEGAQPNSDIPADVVSALGDDLNTPALIAQLHKLRQQKDAASLLASLQFLGFSGDREKIHRRVNRGGTATIAPPLLVDEEKFFPAKVINHAEVERLIDLRNEARRAKNFAESDRIRDELAAMGVVLKDSKDGTTWEIAR
jgi:cysteinyl-tRNA synthetase